MYDEGKSHMYSVYTQILGRLTNSLGYVVKIVDRGLRGFVAFGVAAIMFAIIFHVSGRYLFGKTYMGTMELIRYTMIWVSLLGAVLAFRVNEHVKITVFDNLLSARNNLRLGIVAHLFLMIFLVAMVIGGIDISMRNMQQVSLGLQIPMGYPYLAIPVGAGFMILYVLFMVLENMTELTILEK
jgi:TRAP-type C4-dicarboxylate transport system permease small subunit